ncbi:MULTISPECIES: hypothetical protein [Arsenicicoccus]|uniref:hypothetical protein n=1 Tax=Arsenicicoccus TaxID=267408 RepID=UPI0012E0FA28|nr:MULTISPECIES: hypothetical protein [Arsenicicoccus]
MIALKAQKLSLVLASIALQIVVLGLAGPEIDLPLSKVPLPTVVAWCLPAALTVGLCVESHLEGWNWFNPVRVGGLQSLCAATAALASLGLYRIFVASWPSEHVIALWWAFAAIGLVSRFFVGEGAWFLTLIVSLACFYDLATPDSIISNVLDTSAGTVAALSIFVAFVCFGLRLAPAFSVRV